ncbi:MAG: DUF4350 domain-containing protein [Actinobacteria bacterium]|nr:DUF4350 domain-containing protein [Actinomycetota bacterium]
MKRPAIKLDGSTLVLIGIAVALVLAYAGLVRLSQDYYLVDAPAGSVFAAGDDGLRVLYAYLDELKLSRDTLQSFDELPDSGTIVVAAAAPLERSPTAYERQVLTDWVKQGNRLVLVGAYADEVVKDVGGSPRNGHQATLEPLLPGVYAQGVGEVIVDDARLLLDTPAWATHLKDTDGQYLASRVSGKGEIVWMASVSPMSNAGIGRADNARLATLLVATGGEIYFDEYHHGFVRGGGIWSRMGAGGRSGTLLALAAVALLLWSSARRTGRPIEAMPDRTVRTGAYIGSLAELYRRAGARKESLESLAGGLRLALVRRHGGLEAALAREPRIAELLAEISSAGNISEEQFVRYAREIARARQEAEGRDGANR